MDNCIAFGILIAEALGQVEDLLLIAGLGMTTQRWQVSDYRSRRRLLDPDVFLNGSNPPPTDIVEPEVWDYLMHLADHVSITTSNHHGALLRRLFELERAWVDAIAEKPSFLDTAMVDVMDDFTASMFLLLHGYY